MNPVRVQLQTTLCSDKSTQVLHGRGGAGVAGRCVNLNCEYVFAPSPSERGLLRFVATGDISQNTSQHEL